MSRRRNDPQFGGDDRRIVTRGVMTATSMDGMGDGDGDDAGGLRTVEIRFRSVASEMESVGTLGGSLLTLLK